MTDEKCILIATPAILVKELPKSHKIVCLGFHGRTDQDSQKSTRVGKDYIGRPTPVNFASSTLAKTLLDLLQAGGELMEFDAIDRENREKQQIRGTL